MSDVPGMVQLECRVCGAVYELMHPSLEQIHERLCPRHQKELEREGLDDYAYPLSRSDG